MLPGHKNEQKTLSSTHSGNDSLNACHSWFESMGWSAAEYQLSSWEAQQKKQHGLINAPTGSGKTYAALLPIIARYSGKSKKTTGLRALWITPIRALAREIELSAERAIQGMNSSLTVDIRTGDTSAAARTKQLERLPNILITTPESLHLMLCSNRAHQFFEHLELLVADEWHELIGTKRGVQLELAISRLRKHSPNLLTWGISATIGNLQEAMNCLLGKGTEGVLIKSTLRKQYEVMSILPEKPERMPWVTWEFAWLINSCRSSTPVSPLSSSPMFAHNARFGTEHYWNWILHLPALWPCITAVSARKFAHG
jgi:ATP-dependent Lhr-like helicase